MSSQRLQVAGTLIYFDWFNHKSTKKCWNRRASHHLQFSVRQRKISGILLEFT